jgi:hypothetical protein
MNPNDEDSVRSRAIAGLRYFICGGVVCGATLLMMHEGITALPYWGGVPPLPVEMIAGLAGIVGFMGLLQLLIAWILNMRGRR